VNGSWYSISCGTSGSHTAAVSGGPTSFTLDPDSDFAAGESCTVTVLAANVSDQDTNDPPDTMTANYMFSFTVAEPNPVLVSEVYGGGGNSGAVLKNDFIELYNRSSHSVSLAGWSIQYASSAGTTWQVTPLSGAIPAGRNYLIQEAAGANGTVDLPTPDATGTIAMAAGAGKVALVSNSTVLAGSCPLGGPVVDFVGYGAAANCSETAPTATLTNTTSAQRNGGGATDTDNNSADFTVGTPDPHASGDQAPSVASTIPANGASGVAVDANVSITFSEPVNVTGGWFTINCATSGAHGAAESGGPTTFTLDPSANFAANESCTATVLAGHVTDQDTDDPPDAMAADYVFTFQTADVFNCGDPATSIHTIQGNGLVSPRVGEAHAIEGIVVGDYQSTTSEFGGFYLQEEDVQQDADPSTSEGIFVFDNNFGTNVSVGEQVRVRGTVSEFSGLTELGSVTAVAICSTGNSATPTSVSLPVAAIDDHERYEGMLVRFTQTLTATEVFNLGRFGEVSLSGVGRLYSPSAVAAPGAPAQAKRDENNRGRIILDDGNNQQNIDPTFYPQGGLSATNTLRVGDSLPGLTGVMDYRFSNYRIQPVGPLTWDHTNPRTAAPEPVGGNLKVASFNVLNFFNGDGLGGGFPTSRGANTPFELQRQKAKEVSALLAMNADIVGLMEIENDSGPNSALAELVRALNDATAPGTYAYIDTGVVGTDEIKVALIYKPAKASPVGTWKIITSAIDPRFIDTRNRPSLAQTFQPATGGAKLTVVVNHLKSKGSACGAGDDIDDPSGGNCNGTRTQAAAALVDWLATDPTGSGSPDFLLIGDMNSYTMETPIKEFTDGGYANLVGQFGGLTAYSYVFNGESGYLDHALASPSLAAKTTGVGHWHINPDEPTVLDYNVEFKTANQVNTFYDPGPYRSSDHDPVVIGFQLDNAPPTVSAGGPYTVGEGSSITLNASGSDPEGGTLAYAWDLDDNGSFETPGQSVSFSAVDGPASPVVHVRATDDGGQTATAQATVTVQNVPPTATFSAPASSFAGYPFTLSLTSPSDPSAADNAAGFQYAFDCGSGYGAFGSSASASCPTDDTGTRTVHGKIRDKDGGVTEYAATVQLVVTFDSLCALVTSWSTDDKVTKKLCHELAEAEKASEKGKPKQEQHHLREFEKQLDKKKAGKAFTDEQLATLERLVNRL
jgi:predicted extracellular nuclease